MSLARVREELDQRFDSLEALVADLQKQVHDLGNEVQKLSLKITEAERAKAARIAAKSAKE